MMDKATSDTLSEELDNLSRCLSAQERSAAIELQTALPDWRRPASGLGEKFINLAAVAMHTFPQATLLNISKFVVADLALKLPETLAKRNLPHEVLMMYPAAAKRLLAYLRQDS